jgi:hypothetical protein
VWGGGGGVSARRAPWTLYAAMGLGAPCPARHTHTHTHVKRLHKTDGLFGGIWGRAGASKKGETF